MKQKIEKLNDNERAWLADQLKNVAKFVEAYSPEDSENSLNLAALDRAFAAFLATGQSDIGLVNTIISSVGIAFGQLLVEGLGLEWVIATDEQGSDLAVYGLPGKGDVLIYPANFVAKRWERREKNFLKRSYDLIASQVRDISKAQR